MYDLLAQSCWWESICTYCTTTNLTAASHKLHNTSVVGVWPAKFVHFYTSVKIKPCGVFCFLHSDLITKLQEHSRRSPRSQQVLSGTQFWIHLYAYILTYLWQYCNPVTDHMVPVSRISELQLSDILDVNPVFKAPNFTGNSLPSETHSWKYISSVKISRLILLETSNITIVSLTLLCVL